MISRLWNAALRAAPLRLWALMAAGPALSAAAVGLVFIVWRGDWPEALRGKQLDFLGWSLLLVIGLIGVIVVTLAAVKARVSGPGGSGFEIDGSRYEGRQP